jgi:DNA/RNA endonuclease YhcR with UshA esterase domain
MDMEKRNLFLKIKTLFFLYWFLLQFTGCGSHKPREISSSNQQETQISNPLSQGVIRASDALKYIGQTVTVEALLVKVYYSRKGIVFLDLDQPYPKSPLTLVIFKKDAPRFAHIPACEGKTIRVKGRIQLFRGKPEILLKDPMQIQCLE